MKESLVSIIIPFYNEEQFLERAVLSATGQTYPNVEIILVNDGSTDTSLEIAEKFKCTYSNIFVIDALHHSLGKARNIGIAAAQGTYVLFLDSDDELEVTALAALVENIELAQSDLVICKFALYDSSLKCTNILGWNVNGDTTDAVRVIEALYNRQIIFMSCARMYKLEIVKQCAFPEGLWFEDTPFLLKYILNSKSVSFEKASLWKIHSRPTSITRHLIEPKRIEDAYKIFLLELSILEKSSHYSQLKEIFFKYQIQPLLLNLIFLTSDRKIVANLYELKHTFRLCEQGFSIYFSKSNTIVGPRNWLNLQLLSLHRLVGWKLTFLLLPIIKRKQFAEVHQLRNA